LSAPRCSVAVARHSTIQRLACVMSKAKEKIALV
jgi:hypothetical protein